MMPSLVRRHALTGIVILGAALRLFPIWFGLPYAQARPDESVAIGHSLNILAGDPNPHFFNWPSLTFYVFAGLYKAASVLHVPLDLYAQTLLPRGLVALAGAATILVLARLAQDVAGRATALVAALFLSVAILHVRDSHFATVDVLTTLLATASLALLVAALQSDSVKGFALAGLVGGLATSTKYSVALLMVSMAAAQVVRLSERRNPFWSLRAWAPPLVFAAAFVGGFFAGTPYALIDSGTFATAFRNDSHQLSHGHNILLGRGWTYHFLNTLPYGLGLPIFAASLAGWIPFARQYRTAALVIGAFAASFYLAIGSGYTVFFRYLLPIVPIACFSAAILVTQVGSWIASRTRRSAGVVTALLAALAAGPSLVNSVRLDTILARTDTRVLAAEWLRSRVRAEDTLFDAGGDFTRLDLGTAPFHAWAYDPATRSFGAAGGAAPDWIVIHEAPLMAYTWYAREIRTLLSEKYGVAHVEPALQGRAVSRVYDQQDAFFLPIAGFGGVLRPGPTVWIFHRLDAR
jgi:4-amino-4-deoxy-L-arabinose transferase-like glycosyltransferase